MAPAGTPRPIVERLNRELNAALATEEVRKRLANEGAEPWLSTPEDYAADIDRRGDQMVDARQIDRLEAGTVKAGR